MDLTARLKACSTRRLFEQNFKLACYQERVVDSLNKQTLESTWGWTQSRPAFRFLSARIIHLSCSRSSSRSDGMILRRV